MRDKLVLSLGVLCAVAFILLAGMVGYHMGEGTTTPAPAAEPPPPAPTTPAAPTAQATAPEGSITTEVGLAGAGSSRRYKPSRRCRGIVLGQLLGLLLPRLRGLECLKRVPLQQITQTAVFCSADATADFHTGAFHTDLMAVSKFCDISTVKTSLAIIAGQVSLHLVRHHNPTGLPFLGAKARQRRRPISFQYGFDLFRHSEPLHALHLLPVLGPAPWTAMR